MNPGHVQPPRPHLVHTVSSAGCVIHNHSARSGPAGPLRLEFRYHLYKGESL